MNLRKGPGTSYSKIRQLNKPESYVVWAEKDGWLNLGDEQWVKNDPSYVKFSKKSTVDSSIVGKRVVSKVNNLRFYDAPSWRNKDVAGSVDTGLGFTIDAKVNVNGSPQYKVHNSKGKTYYIKTSEAYVYVVVIKKLTIISQLFVYYNLVFIKPKDMFFAFKLALKNLTMFLLQ